MSLRSSSLRMSAYCSTWLPYLDSMILAALAMRCWSGSLTATTTTPGQLRKSGKVRLDAATAAADQADANAVVGPVDS